MNSLVLDAACQGDADGRLCNADLANLITVACQGKTPDTVVIRCPGCHSQVTVSLSWQTVPVCISPVMLAERA